MPPSPAPPWSTIRFGGAPTRNFSITRSPPRSGSRFHEPCCCLRMRCRPTRTRTRSATWPIRSIGKAIFNYVGWPAFFKPFAGGGWKNVYRLHNPEEFFRAYSETGQLVMMLQEEVKFEMYFRCYSIDQRNVRIMPYEPRHPYHLRYQTEWQAPKEILQKVEQGVLTVESISRLRLEHGRVRHARRRAGGDRFLQSRAGCGSRLRSVRRISNGWSKRFRTWRFAKRASINPVETI